MATSTLIKAIDAPVPGTATVKGTLGVSHPVDGGDIRCSIVMVGVGGLDVNSPGYMRWESNRENTLGTVTGTRSFELPAPGGQGFATVCEEDDGDGALVSANLSILFTPA